MFAWDEQFGQCGFVFFVERDEFGDDVQTSLSQVFQLIVGVMALFVARLLPLNGRRQVFRQATWLRWFVETRGRRRTHPMIGHFMPTNIGFLPREKTR